MYSIHVCTTGVSWIWISMDISMKSMDIMIHVLISDLGHAVNISMNMRYLIVSI